MRTTGTFQDVYVAAREYAMENRSDCPMNPVIRRENEKWMLESGLEPTDGDFEISLDVFDSYFYEGYKSDYMPSESDVDDFIITHTD
jgi:hypothetical protein